MNYGQVEGLAQWFHDGGVGIAAVNARRVGWLEP